MMLGKSTPYQNILEQIKSNNSLVFRKGVDYISVRTCGMRYCESLFSLKKP